MNLHCDQNSLIIYQKTVRRKMRSHSKHGSLHTHSPQEISIKRITGFLSGKREPRINWFWKKSSVLKIPKNLADFCWKLNTHFVSWQALTSLISFFISVIKPRNTDFQFGQPVSGTALLSCKIHHRNPCSLLIKVCIYLPTNKWNYLSPSEI